MLFRLSFQTNESTQTTRHTRNIKQAFTGSWLGCGEAKALLQHSVMPGGQALQPASPSSQCSSPSLPFLPPAGASPSIPGGKGGSLPRLLWRSSSLSSRKNLGSQGGVGIGGALPRANIQTQRRLGGGSAGEREREREIFLRVLQMCCFLTTKPSTPQVEAHEIMGNQISRRRQQLSQNL